MLNFLLEKSEERGSTRNFTKSFKIQTVISHTNDFLKPENRKKNKKGRKRKNEDVTLTNLLKKKNIRNRFFKKSEKENQKGEFKKKEKPFFKTLKKIENTCKKMSNKKKRKQTKPSSLGTEENRKNGVLQKFTRIQKIVKKVMDTENKETIKEQEKANLKRGEKGERTEKTRRDNNRTCGKRMKKGGNEEVKETF